MGTGRAAGMQHKRCIVATYRPGVWNNRLAGGKNRWWLSGGWSAALEFWFCLLHPPSLQVRTRCEYQYLSGRWWLKNISSSNCCHTSSTALRPAAFYRVSSTTSLENIWSETFHSHINNQEAASPLTHRQTHTHLLEKPSAQSCRKHFGFWTSETHVTNVKASMCTLK